MKLWIVSEASKCNTYPDGLCQKGPVAHPGATASPHQQGGGLQLLTGLQDKLDIMLGGQVPTLSTGIFHDDNWKQTTQSDDSPSPNHADGGELGNVDSSRLNQPAEALQTQ